MTKRTRVSVPALSLKEPSSSSRKSTSVTGDKAAVKRKETTTTIGVSKGAGAARKQADDNQRSTSQYARSLVEASLDPLVTISPEGRITDVNAGSVKVKRIAASAKSGSHHG